MSGRRTAALSVVRDSEPSSSDLLRELIRARDEAEAVVKACDMRIRPLAREWADEKPDGVNRRQFTRPSLEQLRKDLFK